MAKIFACELKQFKMKFSRIVSNFQGELMATLRANLKVVVQSEELFKI